MSCLLNGVSFMNKKYSYHGDLAPSCIFIDNVSKYK